MRYDPVRLEMKSFFHEDELDILHKKASEYGLDDLISNPRVFEDRSIDYAYVSSKIEGSTYSEKGVSSLLRYGRTEGGKPLSDALMVCAINRAYLFVMENARDLDVIDKGFVKDLHARAAENVLAPRLRGTVRREAVRIGGSSYEPLASPEQLDAELDYLIHAARTIPDPFDQAAYVHCNLAYLQYFADGNKRTARLMQTAVLVHSGLIPIFMAADEIEAYLDALIAYYESGDRRAYARLFLNSYVRSIDRLLGNTEEQRRQVREDEENLRLARLRRGQ